MKQKHLRKYSQLMEPTEAYKRRKRLTKYASYLLPDRSAKTAEKPDNGPIADLIVSGEIIITVRKP